MEGELQSTYSDIERLSIQSCFPFDGKSTDSLEILCNSIYNINKNFEYFEYMEVLECTDFRNLNNKLRSIGNLYEHLPNYLNPLGLYMGYAHSLKIYNLETLSKKSRISIPTIIRYTKFLENF